LPPRPPPGLRRALLLRLRLRERLDEELLELLGERAIAAANPRSGSSAPPAREHSGQPQTKARAQACRWLALAAQALAMRV
jgi:hypothetical protein